ncbi:MAG: hypothetical protein GTN78_00340 [Gemmatimonadales bacterium]|nr:hypothetical protein [Gemmatimonadales bacterium]NIQ98641.1 hypothetical protein [Gemmatimonadales bacterium]
MIHVQRNQTDKVGAVIKPNDAWFRLAADRTARAIEEQDAHVADRTVYAHAEVRRALEGLFLDKCAYCEVKVEALEVDHFRPKGRVAEREDHPGYYWLTYVWENLYPSCQHCNQWRRDRPRWGDTAELPAGGKADQFPLLDETSRAMRPQDDVHAERRLLIDPCFDDPGEFLGYDPFGHILSVKDPWGSKTIEVLRLYRRSLNAFRREVIAAVTGVMKLLASVAIGANAGASNDLNALLDRMKAGSSQHAGVARYVAKHAATFGV